MIIKGEKMEFIIYMIKGSFYFLIASMPLILVFIQLKCFKIQLKATTYCLLLNVIISIFFWTKLKDINLAIYQSIPYVCSFLWLWAESVLQKKENNSNSKRGK